MHLIKPIVKSLFRMLTLLIAVSIFAFALVSASPIDPVQSYVGAGVSVSPEQRENIAAYWGLDEPPVQRYFTWAGSLLRGDFGTSLVYRRPVLLVIGERFANSLALMGFAWVLAGVMGLGLGILMGANHGKPIDRFVKSICLTLSSTPTFWVGMLMLMVFSVGLGWFPIGLAAPAGMLAEDVTVLQRLHHLLLPALTLSFSSFANIALHTRQKLSDVLKSDYVLFAKARGENPKTILLRHGLRNILLPAVTLQFASLSELFGGSVLAEQVFSYPGLGQAAVQAGLRADIPLLLGITLFSALFVFAGNLIANLLYLLIDPKMRKGGAK